MDSNLLKLLITGFVMGWGPCLPHSAAVLLPYIGATKTGWREGIKSALLFSLGKLSAFLILGLLATVAFGFLNRFFSPPWTSYLYLLVGVCMVLLGVAILASKGISNPFSKLLNQKILDKGNVSMLLLGFLLGIAPCVPLLGVFSYIGCVAGNIPAGILYAFSFGLGNVVSPVVLGVVAGLVPGKIFTSPKVLKIFQLFCGLVLLFLGLELIWRIWK